MSSSISSSSVCGFCGKSEGVRAGCAACKSIRYCDRECQKKHWKTHKAVCGKTAQANALAEEKIFAPVPSSSSSSVTPASSSASDSSSSSAPAIAAEPFKLPPAHITLTLPSTLSPAHPLIEVKDLPGKGRGFIATAAIEPGTLLLEEESIYAHCEGVGASEERRALTLCALTGVMVEKFPEALKLLCLHPDHELPEHESVENPPAACGLNKEQWMEALSRVDCNQFSSSEGMMLSPTVSITNHSCYPNADLVVREVPASAAGSDSEKPATVERVSIYAIQPIAAGEEVCINYLGSDSLCRWYAPAMIRQESFQSQWGFTCNCLRCVGGKAKAIDKTITYSPQGMDEAMEQRYTELVLSEKSLAPNPKALLQLYRDMFDLFDGERFYHHYLLHQLRTMLIFMPAAFDDSDYEARKVQLKKQAGAGGKGKKEPVINLMTGEQEWVQLLSHHLQSLKNHLLNPPFHSIKSDTVQVIMRSSDFIGAKYSKLNANKSDADVVKNVEIRQKVTSAAHDCDGTYLEEAVFQKLYPDTHKLMMEYYVPDPEDQQ